MDGVLTLYEIIHETKVKKQNGLVVNLDFEKAYNKVNWEFLFNCME